VASATAAGATGTATLAGAALEQARVLAGHPPADVSRTAAPSEEVETSAIRSETAGLTALSSGHPDEAVAAFARAADHWRQLGLTVWLARALSLQATAARQTGDHPTADRLSTGASEVLDQLKAPAHARPTVLTPLGGQGDRP
jgi:hypothetical protein